jgi:hypothetical protein
MILRSATSLHVTLAECVTQTPNLSFELFFTTLQCCLLVHPLSAELQRTIKFISSSRLTASWYDASWTGVLSSIAVKFS